MKNQHKKIDKEELLLENKKNFLSLDDLSEEELPIEENEVFPQIDREFSNKVLDNYFKQLYGSERDLEIAKKFYGVGQDTKSISNLAKEYSLSHQRVQQIVSKPLCTGWKSTTIKILDSIKSDKLDSLKNDNFFNYDYSFLSK